MTIVNLKSKNCACGRSISTKTIDIESFRKEMFAITDSTLMIWNNKKCCWRCKKKPEVGENWGISINNGEKNRIFCPECAEFIENELKNESNRGL